MDGIVTATRGLPARRAARPSWATTGRVGVDGDRGQDLVQRAARRFPLTDCSLPIKRHNIGSFGPTTSTGDQAIRTAGPCRPTDFANEPDVLDGASRQL